MGELIIVAGIWQESDSQIWKIAGHAFQNFRTWAESDSEKVTPATSARQRMWSTLDWTWIGLDPGWRILLIWDWIRAAKVS